ncbi:MAG: BREX protein BrxB domain-containing protein [Limisphaerales bacterium]
MSSPSESFDELWQRLRSGHELTNTGDDPVYYLVFKPDQMLEVKRLHKQWAARLAKQGWIMETMSMAQTVLEIFRGNDLRDVWLASPANTACDRESVAEINKTLEDVLIADDLLKRKIEAKLHSLRGRKRTVLFMTDLEALHPYLRVGILEQKLQGKFTVPTVILYPGVRDGKSTLRFLGFYPPDGNYRSVHIGG